MSMSDTAEYWWDLKDRKSSRVFIHIKGYDCGHFHLYETKKLSEVDCYACLRHIEKTQELKQRLEQSKKAIEDNKFKHGKCSCGNPMRVRKNRVTGEEFLGCSNYPTCKNTKSL